MQGLDVDVEVDAAGLWTESSQLFPRRIIIEFLVLETEEEPPAFQLFDLCKVHLNTYSNFTVGLNTRPPKLG